MAIAGIALSAAATQASADVSYNSASQVNGNAKNGAGTWTNGAATGYTGNLPVDWKANFQTNTDSFSLSTAAAQGAGAAGYNLSVSGYRWNPNSSWGNALDYGLITLQSASNLTVTVQGDTGSTALLPGFTLWQGWDTAAGSSKHGTYQTNPFTPGTRGATGISYLGFASTGGTTTGGVSYASDGGVNYSSANGVVQITFENLLAGNYSLWIGGNGTATTSFSYTATLTASPVPIPGAVWLFGSSVAGLIGVARRRAKA